MTDTAVLESEMREAAEVVIAKLKEDFAPSPRQLPAPMDADAYDVLRILSALDEARERAEHAERFCYRAAKAAGQHEFVCAETVSLRAERDAAIRERDEAREACAKKLEDFRAGLKGWPNEALDALSRAARMLRGFDPHGDSVNET